MSDQPTADECVWTRLPGDPHPFEINRARFQMGCNGRTASGRIAVCPSVCTACGKPVRPKS